MLLSAEDHVASCDFDMDCADDSEGLPLSCQERKPALSLSEHQPTGKKTQQTRSSKARGPYRRYTAYQIEKLFDLVIEEGKSAKDAALITDINIRTAQHYIKKYNDNEKKCLPIRCSKPAAGRKGKLTGEHSKFLVEYTDERPTAVLSDIKYHLCKAFPELTISISALHRHLVQKCKVILKKLEKLSAARNSDRVVALRKEKTQEWMATSGLDFCKNCVFIDEAGFNLHTQKKSWSFSKRSPSKRRRSHRYIVEETPGYFNIKEEKVHGKAVDAVNGRMGTRTEHYLAYLSDTMDILDRNNMQGYYLVMHQCADPYAS